jgi:adenylate cyclase
VHLKKVKYLFLLILIVFANGLNAQDTIVLETIRPTKAEKISSLLSDADTVTQVSLRLRLLLEALKLAEQAPVASQLFDLNQSIGKIYATEQLNERALAYYKAAEKQEVESTKLLGLDLEIGNVYDQLEKPDSASLYYRKVLENFEARNDYAGRLKLHQKLVGTFLNNNKYDLALNENYKIKQLAESVNDVRHLPVIYNNIGYNFNYLKDYEKAVEYFRYAEASNKSANQLDLAVLYTNIGIAYNNIGDLKNALDYLQKAKKELKGNLPGTATYLDHLIARIYLNNKDLYNANEFNGLAMENAIKHKQYDILVEAYNTAALIHQDLFEYELALDFYKKHLELRDSFRLEDRLRQERLIQQQILLERSEKEIRLLLVNQEVQDLAIRQLKLEKDKIQLEKGKQESELKAIKKGEEAREANLKSAELEKEKAQQELLLTAGRLDAERKNRTIYELEQDGILSKAELEKKQAEIARQEAETLQKEKENELLVANAEIYEQTEAIDKLEIEKQGNRLNFARWIGALLLVLSLIVLGSLLYSKKKNRELALKNIEIAKSRDIIEEEREKSENLLLNILPKETAIELKESGVATPKHYEKVTILFSDFSGFTRISRHMSPVDLLKELNECFRAFDEIVDEFGLEKIKTLGDGYMAAGGIPISNDTNPVDALKAALKINEFMINRSIEKRAAGITYWDTRLGLHTGQVIAGVVGTRKFAYDIWGDAVNTASRMESGGEVGKVNISEDTFGLIKDHFDCTFRGEIEIKNRGKIGMYFVEREKD